MKINWKKLLVNIYLKLECKLEIMIWFFGIDYFSGYASVLVIFITIIIIITLFQFGFKNRTKWKNPMAN